MFRCLDVHDHLAGMGTLPVRHTGSLPARLTHGALGHGFSDADVARTTSRPRFFGSIMSKLKQQVGTTCGVSVSVIGRVQHRQLR